MYCAVLCCAAQEFDPAEFYDLMEAAEWRAREVVQVDVPKYILGKLGLADTVSPDSSTRREHCLCSDSVLVRVHILYMYSTVRFV